MKQAFLRRSWRLAGIAALAAAVVTCAVNPVTGKRELSLVSEGQEIQMGQQYAQLGGPVSLFGLAFFSNLLDWLAEDQDLVALQSRATTDRTLKFVEDAAPNADPRVVEQQLATKMQVLKAANVVLPCLLLAAFGLLVFLFRRAQKRSFLESIG